MRNSGNRYRAPAPKVGRPRGSFGPQIEQGSRKLQTKSEIVGPLHTRDMDEHGYCNDVEAAQSGYEETSLEGRKAYALGISSQYDLNGKQNLVDSTTEMEENEYACFR